MSILGNFNNFTSVDEDEIEEKFKVPKLAKMEDEGLTLKKCIVLSSVLHPAVIFLLVVIGFILLFLGVKFDLLSRPQQKVADIEFVLVDKEQMPINKNTKYRSDKNSRAGGKHDPKKKVSKPSPATKKSPTTANSTQQLIKKVAKQQVQTAKAKPVQKPVTQAPKQVSQAQPTQKPVMPTAKPAFTPPSVPKISTTPKAPIGLPAPPSLPTGHSYSTGPVGDRTASSGAYSTSRTSSSGGGTLSSAGTVGSRGGSGAYGNAGPGGNPNAPWGVDALREPNFAPYMRELQSRIKYNWDPPKGNESKRVVLIFRIAKNGQLLSNRVSKSSGLPAADRAALNAVEITAPFKPLPPEFRGQYIDIQFTFDYNVFGASGY